MVSGVALSKFHSHILRSLLDSCDSCTSSSRALNCGITFGPSFAPLRFCIYMRPLELTLKMHDGRNYIYADDAELNLPFDHRDSSTPVNRLNVVLLIPVPGYPITF